MAKKEVLTYDLLAQYAKEHYDLIYDLNDITEKEGCSLLDEIRILKYTVNSKIVERNILFQKLSKVIIFTLLTTFSAPFLISQSFILVLIFLINVIGMVKNMREYKEWETNLETEYTDINKQIQIILGNCERMLNKKLKDRTNNDKIVYLKEKEENKGLELYANCVLEHYLKTGEMAQFANPEFDKLVKQELLAILAENYNINPQMKLKDALKLAQEYEENGLKLVKNRKK